MVEAEADLPISGNGWQIRLMRQGARQDIDEIEAVMCQLFDCH